MKEIETITYGDYVKHTSVVCPAQETPKHSLWISNLDLVDGRISYVPLVYFYRRLQTADCSNFFECCLLKEALSKVLVTYYPLAGRLARDANERLEIDCNAEGVLFIEAETSCAIDEEFGDDEFTPSLKMRQLVPTIDYSTTDISSYPLLILQVTYFKCGGVCLGVGWHHVLGDGTSAFHFIETWAKMTRGFSISIPPFIDRTILISRTPAYPSFDHIEYLPSPSLSVEELQSASDPTSFARFKLSLDQINTLKAKLKKDHGAIHSTFEILAAHVWRCTCMARGLCDDQPTKLYIPVNGRSRLNPPLSSRYLGNVIFTTSPIVLVGDIQSKPLIYTVKIIHEALKRMNDEYLRSALAYVEQHNHDLTTPKKGVLSFACPNLRLVSWVGMPMYETNFGWGLPIYMGPAIILFEAMSYIMPSPSEEKNLSVIICLKTRHMQLVKKFFYSEGVGPMKNYYKPSSL